MTHKHFSPALLGKLGLILLVGLLLLSGTAAAGEFIIDVDDAQGTVEVGKTVQVPVKVIGADNLFSVELQFNTGTTADAVIAFNEDSMGSFIYNQQNGKVAQINLKITGSKTLFYLDVTPITGKDIPLDITTFKIREEKNGIRNLVQYAEHDAVLTVEGGSVTPPPEIPPVNPPEDKPDTPPSGGSQGGISPQPSVNPTTTPTETVPPVTTPTPSETLPTFTPTAMPTDDAPKSGGSYLPYIIAVLGVFAVLIIIILIVKRRSDD